MFEMKYWNVISKDIRSEDIKINELEFKVLKNMKCTNNISDAATPLEYFFNSFVDQKYKFENKEIV